MHQGHEIVKCECGKVIRQCRCIDPFKSTVIQRPCKCENKEETLEQTLAQISRDACKNHKGLHGFCYIVNNAVAEYTE